MYLVQEGVPEAIAALIEGGMRVWMITGDKQETAINIGISCGLINDPEHLLVQLPTAASKSLRNVYLGSCLCMLGKQRSLQRVINLKWHC